MSETIKPGDASEIFVKIRTKPMKERSLHAENKGLEGKVITIVGNGKTFHHTDAGSAPQISSVVQEKRNTFNEHHDIILLKCVVVCDAHVAKHGKCKVSSRKP